MSQFRSLGKWVWILRFRFCVSTFEASPSESEISLSEGCAGTCVSRSSGFSVKGCNQSGMSCVGFSSYISFSVSAEPRLSEACLSGFVCIGFPHACLARRVVIGSVETSDLPEDFDWSFGLDVEAELLLKYDDSLDTTRGTELSIIQVIVFPFGVNREFHRFSTRMNIRVLSKGYQTIELLAFLWVIALWRTDRDREDTLVPPRLFALLHLRSLPS